MVYFFCFDLECGYDHSEGTNWLGLIKALSSMTFKILDKRQVGSPVRGHSRNTDVCVNQGHLQPLCWRPHLISSSQNSSLLETSDLDKLSPTPSTHTYIMVCAYTVHMCCTNTNKHH